MLNLEALTNLYLCQCLNPFIHIVYDAAIYSQYNMNIIMIIPGTQFCQLSVVSCVGFYHYNLIRFTDIFRIVYRNELCASLSFLNSNGVKIKEGTYAFQRGE